MSSSVCFKRNQQKSWPVATRCYYYHHSNPHPFQCSSPLNPTQRRKWSWIIFLVHQGSLKGDVYECLYFSSWICLSCTLEHGRMTAVGHDHDRLKRLQMCKNDVFPLHMAPDLFPYLWSCYEESRFRLSSGCPCISNNVVCHVLLVCKKFDHTVIPRRSACVNIFQTAHAFRWSGMLRRVNDYYVIPNDLWDHCSPVLKAPSILTNGQSCLYCTWKHLAPTSSTTIRCEILS